MLCSDGVLSLCRLPRTAATALLLRHDVVRLAADAAEPALVVASSADSARRAGLKVHVQRHRCCPGEELPGQHQHERAPSADLRLARRHCTPSLGPPVPPVAPSSCPILRHSSAAAACPSCRSTAAVDEPQSVHIPSVAPSSADNLLPTRHGRSGHQGSSLADEDAPSQGRVVPTAETQQHSRRADGQEGVTAAARGPASDDVRLERGGVEQPSTARPVLAQARRVDDPRDVGAHQPGPVRRKHGRRVVHLPR